MVKCLNIGKNFGQPIYRSISSLIRIWPIWRNPHQYTPDHPGVCDDVNLKTLVQTRMGDINGDDSRSAI